MGVESKIEWTDHTWNPWIGCTPVSEGCHNCYAKRWSDRFDRDFARPSKTSDKTFRLPLSSKVKAGDRVFVCSLSDFWHHRVPTEWRAEAFEIMLRRPDVKFLIPTKRPQFIDEFTENAGLKIRLPFEHENQTKQPDCDSPSEPYKHIWLGISASCHRTLIERGEALLRSRLAWWSDVRFLSAEPLLTPLSPHLNTLLTPNYYGSTMPSINWVIAGGESGPGARPMNPSWVRQVRDECLCTNVPFFFKQWGEHDCNMDRVGKHRAGRLLDGREWNQTPKVGDDG